MRLLVTALSLSLVACDGTGGSSSSIEGSWSCEGAKVKGSDGSSWDPSEKEITVVADGGDWLLTGWSECQPEIDLTATGDDSGIDVDPQSCDTNLGYVEIKSLGLYMDGSEARYSGRIHSVVTDPISLKEDFEWEDIACSRL